jgi:hypothetical protein
MSHYPEDYVQLGPNVAEHILETVERFEEDLTDHVRVHGPLDVVIEVGEAIEISPERRGKTEPDPVMQAIEEQLTSMLAGLASESPLRDLSATSPAVVGAGAG